MSGCIYSRLSVWCYFNIITCFTLSTTDYVCFQSCCYVLFSYSFQLSGVAPFILAWLVSKNLTWAKSGRGQRLAQLLTEPRRWKWHDSLKSHAKPLGMTRKGVMPRDSTDQIWSMIIMRQLVTPREMTLLPRIGADQIWLKILWRQGKWPDSLQDKIFDCPSQDCRHHITSLIGHYNILDCIECRPLQV